MTNLSPSEVARASRPYPTFSSANARINARSFPRSPYIHAALMYARRWNFRLSALWLMVYFCFCAVLVTLQIWDQSEWDSDRPNYPNVFSRTYQINEMQHGAPHIERTIFVFACLAVFAGPALMAIHGHLKTRLTDWTATLLPRYRSPHLTIAILCTITIVAFSCTLFDLAIPYSPTAMLAVGVMLAALTAWLCALPQRLAALLAIMTLAIFSFKSIDTDLTFMLMRQDSAGSAFFLTFSTLALAGAYFRLYFIGESNSSRQQAEHLRLGAPRLRRHGNKSLESHSLFRRIALWRVPTSSGLLPIAAGAGLFLLIVTICLMQSKSGRNYTLLPAIPLACLSFFIPVMAVGSQWLRRLSSLGFEFTRPTTRGAFIRDLGLSLAVDWFTWWLPMTLGGFAGAVFSVDYANPHFFYNVPMWEVAMYFAAYSIPVQILHFGLLASIARFQIPWLIYCAITVSVLLSLFWIIVVVDNHLIWMLLEIPGAFVVGGVILIAHAGYGWMRVDLK
ncbi:MAG TPA: hypothetical protein VFE58_15300 [Tepidisphaeraceae bacterium]|jgi:hypothetical protein|nr:hypothetical protein [Tepidisphaeraceae bacterium]